MYRQYENPYSLEKQLKVLKAEYENETDEGRLVSLAEEISGLKERINFAWQDDEEF